MRQYRHRYEQTRSLKAIVRVILIIGIIAGAIIFGLIYVTDYIEKQYIAVTKRTFSDLEKKQFNLEYGFSLGEDLYPLYEFRQGYEDDSFQYQGVVLEVKTDIESVLVNCMGMELDSDACQRICFNCKDYFIDGDYNGQLETLYTDAGKAKAIQFGVDGNRHQFYIYEITEGNYQLLVRRKT